MFRTVLAVVVGYIVMFVVVFATFTAAYLGMGAERAFRPGSYDVTALWLAVSFILGFVAAVLGGVACARIGGAGRAPALLAAVVVVLGTLMAVPSFLADHAATPPERTGETANFEAMRMAQQPKWVSLLNPVVGAVGVLVGAQLAGGSKKRPGTA